MKKLFLFLLPALLLVACKSAEKHREPVMKLSSEWDATTKDITDFQATVSADLTNYTKTLAAVQPDDATRAKLTPQQVTVWEASQKTVTDALGSYAPLQKTINDFVATWSQKSAEVTALKDGVEKGKLDGDVDAKIAELNAMNATARENLNAWKASYATIKGSVDASMASLQQGAMPPM